MQYSLPLDFVLTFCREMIPEHGEDSYCYSFCDTAGLVGVFDGCGGAGARKHDLYSGHTEAYMASRLCAGAFYDCFGSEFPCNRSAQQLIDEVFVPELARRLQTYAPSKDQSEIQIKGSMVRTLPTTAAVALLQQADNGDVLVSAVWAGDSRVYILDQHGLAQLSVDDTTVSDPMENLYEDGILRNVLCSDKKINLNLRTIRVRPPFTVLTATDGCFGYVSTPMEFEGAILGTLIESSNVAGWETKLGELLGGIAGDDHTLCMASFGYSSFETLKNSMQNRYAYVRDSFLIPVSRLPIEDRQSRAQLWDQYKAQYFRYLKD